MFTAVCYDIPDDRRRARIAAILKDVGVRVQKSVFEADIGDERLARLLRRLQRVLDEQSDSVRVYRICEGCRGKAIVLCGPPTYEDPAVIVVTGRRPIQPGLDQAGPAASHRARSRAMIEPHLRQ